jgi:hypothetical protein
MAPKPKTTFAKPEKTDLWKIILFWIFVVVSLAGIAWMIYDIPHEKRLNCSSGSQSSLIGFGTCTEE